MVVKLTCARGLVNGLCLFERCRLDSTSFVVDVVFNRASPSDGDISSTFSLLKLACMLSEDLLSDEPGKAEG